MPRPSIIVLAVDGLRASALGAYGATWYATPAFDRLASESLVSDWFFADAHDLPTIYRSLWTSAAPWERDSPDDRSLAGCLGAEGFETLLVADDERVVNAPGAGAFSRCSYVEPPRPGSPANDAADTATAMTLAMLLEELEQCRADRPVFAWGHLRFAHGAWDAPLSLAERLLDEDDPRPCESLAPPSGATEEAEDPEFAFESTVRYAAQVMALDGCVGVVTNALDDVLGADDYALVVLGTRGYALGEHGRVGGDDERSYSEMRHAPLIVCPAGAVRRHRRHRALKASERLACDLSETLQTPALRDAKAHPDIVLASPVAPSIHNEHWKLVSYADGRQELYSKPDDRWEMNDVAVRESLVVEELAAQLRERTGGGGA